MKEVFLYFMKEEFFYQHVSIIILTSEFAI